MYFSQVHFLCERILLVVSILKAPKLLISKDVIFDELARLRLKEQKPEQTIKEVKTTINKRELEILDQLGQVVLPI